MIDVGTFLLNLVSWPWPHYPSTYLFWFWWHGEYLWHPYSRKRISPCNVSLALFPPRNNPIILQGNSLCALRLYSQRCFKYQRFERSSTIREKQLRCIGYPCLTGTSKPSLDSKVWKGNWRKGFALREVWYVWGSPFHTTGCFNLPPRSYCGKACVWSLHCTWLGLRSGVIFCQDLIRPNPI